MPVKVPSQLGALPPYARQLVEKPELLLQTLNRLLSTFTGRSITDLDLAGSLAFQENPTAYTIATGVITVQEGTGANTASRSAIAVDTQGAAATDDLDTINGGRDGMVLLVRPYSDTHTVVVKNGTGNILIDGGDATLDSYSSLVLMVYISTLSKWVVVVRAGGSGGGGSHSPVTLNAGADPALSLVGQELNLADVLTPAEHTAIGNSAPHHAAVTVGGLPLTISGQEITFNYETGDFQLNSNNLQIIPKRAFVFFMGG